MPLGADADVTFLEEGGESIPKGLYLLIWWLRNTCSVLLESFLTLSSWNFKETFLFKKDCRTSGPIWSLVFCGFATTC